jgi:hypothetical protein
LAKKGHLKDKYSAFAECSTVAQKLNLQRQAPFLPMQCYAFALFFRVDIQQVRNYFKNKSKIL